MITIYNDMVIGCAECGARCPEVGFGIQFHVLWANQYGSKIRVFCGMCGCVTNKENSTKTNHITITELQPWKCKITGALKP